VKFSTCNRHSRNKATLLTTLLNVAEVAHA
jgi:hypothetical protein